MNNDSIILQLDESTKKLMEEINGDLTSSITDKIRSVTTTVKEINDTVDDISSKTNIISDVYDSTKSNGRKIEEKFSSLEAVIRAQNNSIADLKATQDAIISQMNIITSISSAILKCLAANKNG